MGIKGYTIEEVAKSRKEKLDGDYAFIKQKKAEIRNMEEEIKRIRETVNKLEFEYRIKSVYRVLEYIRGKKITDQRKLDTYLCHCQNKLNGNIDGIELSLGGEE